MSAFEQLSGRLQVTRGRLGAAEWQERNVINTLSIGERLVIIQEQQYEQKISQLDGQQQQNVE